ncbi:MULTISPECIES: pirin family protein [unclassified Brenneria]|uniref:pirin family protein n=1 Tax=unclassified Brenneria TaxID=2634434 RepID=UPI001553BFC9|nr:MULTISPECIES: pirin family protein [unclassified Brenneria]MBJ7222544.1 pirin family protein [Brenneria sp. L3-3C-1]MEE3643787.1 pirin family protein [Brenneria sp. L3_3C_1]MEE3651260.1 pirin family protein [Brenneria sp. HEZEL_4_2_4]NPD01216.1 pirin family protein [Brenneria sp. hezel4-2-4]
MIIRRAAEQCGQADYGWLQARYTFSFGHYFDPQLLGYASLRVLNQEVLTPGSSFQPRTYPRVDILNIILQGEVEYRGSDGLHVQAKEGDALLLATQPNVSYSEHNISPAKPLTRMQLWLNACPTRENSPLQRLTLNKSGHSLLASPEGEQSSMQLRQQVWIHHLELQKNAQQAIKLNGNQAYLQLIHGSMAVSSGHQHRGETLYCGDGAFIQQETELTMQAATPLRALLIDLVV